MASKHSKSLTFAFIINTLLTIVEYSAGLLSGSAAILADGSQNLTDSLVITIAYVCEQVAGRNVTKSAAQRIFRIAGVLNASILLLLAIGIGALAVYRTLHQQAISSTLVIAIGLLSIVINFWAAGLLFTARRSVSITAPYTGLLFSGLSGMGVLSSGLVAHIWHVYQVDGITGIAISLLLLHRSLRMLSAAITRPQRILRLN